MHSPLDVLINGRVIVVHRTTRVSRTDLGIVWIGTAVGNQEHFLIRIERQFGGKFDTIALAVGIGQSKAYGCQCGIGVPHL